MGCFFSFSPADPPALSTRAGLGSQTALLWHKTGPLGFWVGFGVATAFFVLPTPPRPLARRRARTSAEGCKPRTVDDPGTSTDGSHRPISFREVVQQAVARAIRHKRQQNMRCDTCFGLILCSRGFLVLLNRTHRSFLYFRCPAVFIPARFLFQPYGIPLTHLH